MNYSKLFGLFSAIVIALPVTAVDTINLAGDWRLAGTDEKGAAVECPIAVPGGVHTALIKAGISPDPFFGRTERDIQWVGRHDWTISRTFDASADLLAKKAIVLRLEDVDLFADIYLNGNLLGATSNRFCRYEFDLKPYLKPGVNELKGVFKSSENECRRLDELYSLSLIHI